MNHMSMSDVSCSIGCHIKHGNSPRRCAAHPDGRAGGHHRVIRKGNGVSQVCTVDRKVREHSNQFWGNIIQWIHIGSGALSCRSKLHI